MTRTATKQPRTSTIAANHAQAHGTTTSRQPTAMRTVNTAATRETRRRSATLAVVEARVTRAAQPGAVREPAGLVRATPAAIAEPAAALPAVAGPAAAVPRVAMARATRASIASREKSETERVDTVR